MYLHTEILHGHILIYQSLNLTRIKLFFKPTKNWTDIHRLNFQTDVSEIEGAHMVYISTIVSENHVTRAQLFIALINTKRFL